MTDIREQEMQGKINELTAQKASLEAENKQLRKQVEWLRKAQFRPQVGNQESRVPGRTDEPVQ